MRTSRRLVCANLHALGLDSSRQYTPAEIKAAFLQGAKSTHPDTGGDPVRFRQLKDAYDALRQKETAEAARHTPHYADDVGARGPSASASHAAADRSHIYTERYNCDGRREGGDHRTWDYGSGERYANESTRSFYRPYTSNYHDPSATGFTRAEVARAELAMRLHALKRILWNCLVYGSALYLLWEYWPAAWSVRDPAAHQDGLDAREKARRTFLLRQAQPELQPHWSDAQKARYLEEWNNRFRDREEAVALGQHIPFSDAGSAHLWHGSSAAALTVQRRAAQRPSLDTYCDMADEDLDE